MHQARIFGHAALLAILLASAGSAAATDHFVCYTAPPAAGAARFTPRPGVSIADAIGAATAEVRKPGYLCAPADLNGGDPSAPAHPDHLEDYRTKPASRFSPVRGKPSARTQKSEFLQPNGVDVCGGAPCVAP